MSVSLGRLWRALRRWLKPAPPREVIPNALWLLTLEHLPVCQALSPEEREQLHGMAERFLGGRSFYGAESFVPSMDMKVQIAAQACLPVLHLGERWLDPIRSIVLYADAFVSEHETMDEAGVVHRQRDVRAGEAWEHGTLVLSWADVAAAAEHHRVGFNVVIHEIAHFLDGANGAENGFPPLARGHDHKAWTEAFSAAFNGLNKDLEVGHAPRIDPYAATAPAEFFAVASELFFDCPKCLAKAYPEVYRHLARFYRVDRLASASA